MPVSVCLFVCISVPPGVGVRVQGKGGGARRCGSRVGVGVHGKGGDQGVGNPGGRFTGVESDQRGGRSSGDGKRVGGVGSGWRWRRGSIQVTGSPGGEAPWLARGPPKAGLIASISIKSFQN